MARNVEIKARIMDLEALEARVAELATAGPQDIVQDDTFFHCTSGRLKLRRFSASAGELIAYHRADETGPKISTYRRCPTDHPDDLRDCLALAHGVAGRVVKERRLYLAGRTRIHLDRVEGLGTFMELEVVLGETESAEDGEHEARRLMAALGIKTDALIEGAYLDLQAPS